MYYKIKIKINMSGPVGAGSEGPGGSVPDPGTVDCLLIPPVLVVCPHLAL